MSPICSLTNSINSNMAVYIFFLLILFYPATVWSLECYVCSRQDSNAEKCVKTLQTCNIEEDRCLSEVRWGSTPYWAPTGEKQYYISKSCASANRCQEVIRNVSRRCDRIWYNDWECAECCQGDRCNYYTTLEATNLKPGILSIMMVVLLYSIL